MNTYVIEQARWRTALAALSDGELVATFNKQVGLTAFNSARAAYLQCLKETLLDRDFDCSILMKQYQGHEVFILAHQVHLQKGKLLRL
jgi:hypothetical protein